MTCLARKGICHAEQVHKMMAAAGTAKVGGLLQRTSPVALSIWLAWLETSCALMFVLC
jgi:hypothetical protein